MHVTRLEISGFKSFAKKTTFDFTSPLVAIVGPNGSGKSNVAEAIRFVLGEQSMKSMRGKRGEDMIWNGSNAVPRMSRASVALTFDNTSHFLNVDFEEVVVERVVHRDGTNEYRLNGTQVRLKDILELLAQANIGQSGHHIISQGEADKILSASPRDRREMLEDALGLKVFQYKKDEASRKLDRTEENMRQVEALRREVQPHLKFLKRQVDKIEKAETLRTEALSRFAEYFAREHAYLKKERGRLEGAQSEARQALTQVEKAVGEARTVLASSAEDAQSKEIVSLSESLDRVRREREVAAREAARLDGQIDALSRSAVQESVSRKELEALLTEAEQEFKEKQGSLEMLAGFVSTLFTRLKALSRGERAQSEELEGLRTKKDEAEALSKRLASEEDELERSLETIRTELDEARVEEREKERALFELTTKERDLRHQLSSIEGDLSRLTLEEDEWKRELGEAGALLGKDAVQFEGLSVPDAPREEQERERRELQKIKIRLEEMGAGGGEDVLKEYKEATQREAFLEQELEDLKTSADSLKTLITDLEHELRSRFKGGMGAINTEFSRLFGLMFDGGTASLVFTQEPRRIKSLVDENDDGIPDELEKPVEGIEISLSIPRKRIKSLVMLSGGERALTSIALIFAMSLVNPPPFLVLDETDAALDEANSRRYGDMVAALAKKSQLMLITHNRETMSRAGVLYGVTMADSGVSKVLSVQLEEAVQVAK